MAGEHSVTQWIAQAKKGDPLAAEALFCRYFQQMARVARGRLHSLPGAAIDEEDVALSAFERFRHQAANGKLAALADRNELWPLLVKLVCDKARDKIKHEQRRKRDGRRVLSESAFESAGGKDAPLALAQIASQAATPELQAMMAEGLQQRLNQLPDDRCREVALLRLEGWRVLEIAEKLDCPKRTIERLLSLIRECWT
jgi:RNA polymerase sigma factor (sigma-70 family)